MKEDFSKLPKSPKEAKVIGSKYYFTGKPCKRGHVTKRTTSSHKCVDCGKVYTSSPKAKETSRRWREVNREHKREMGGLDYQKIKMLT